MEITEEIIYLSGFAPLIQLWAGICLLFFYEGLLKESPLDAYRKQTKELYDNFMAKYQDYIDTEKMPQCDYYLGTKWEDFLPTIKNMAALSFFYSVMVLAYIGIETNPLYENRYMALQVTNAIMILYMALSIFRTHWGLFHTYLTPILYFAGILLYFHFFPDINEWCLDNSLRIGDNLSRTTISVTTIFTCIIGLFFILLHLGIDYIVLSRRRRSFTVISTNFELLVSVKLKQASITELPVNLKKKISKKISAGVLNDGDYTTEKLNKYIQEEINDELDSFTTPWYRLIWRKGKKAFCQLIGVIFRRIMNLLRKKQQKPQRVP